VNPCSSLFHVSIFAADIQGLGNRLPGLVTAFALALLTDRVLLVDDAVGKYYGLFSPVFDCNYTWSRRGLRAADHRTATALSCTGLSVQEAHSATGRSNMPCAHSQLTSCRERMFCSFGPVGAPCSRQLTQSARWQA